MLGNINNNFNELINLITKDDNLKNVSLEVLEDTLVNLENKRKIEQNIGWEKQQHLIYNSRCEQN